MLGTIIQISVQTDGSKVTRVKALDAVEQAFGRFSYVLKKFSRFDENSELSELNSANGKWFGVSAELFMLIENAIKLSKETDYLYDPTIIDILSVYGYDKSFDEKRIAEMVEKPSLNAELKEVFKNRPKVSEIKLDKKSHEIKLAPKQKIDLGASAKGYAIDLAAEILIKAGIKDFIVNAGGDIRVGGKKKVALFDPRSPEKAPKMIGVTDQAIAGSGNFAKQVGIFKHIISPKIFPPKVLSPGKATKAKTDEVLQTYVIASTAMQADMWATALFLLGEKGLKMVIKKGYKGIVIKKDS